MATKAKKEKPVLTPEEMARMGLDRPGSMKDRLEAWALAGALQAVTKHPN